LVEALRYKPQGSASIPDEIIEFFNFPNSSSGAIALGLTKLETEMSTRNFPGVKARTARKADITAICEPIV
jgi:hypothetical protein